MKAPDKLYISHLIYDTFMYQTPDPDDETQVEYIRKDALLEWANARKAGLSSGESFVAGERKMLKEVLEKLNSM